MMVLSLNSSLSIRIGAHDVVAQLNPCRGPARTHVAAVSDVEDSWTGAATALNDVLARIGSDRWLVSPHVRIAIGAPYVNSGVLHFATLPRSASDRRLIVAQRFCRDHKFNARDTMVAFSTHPSPNGELAVLADAAPKAFIDAVLTTTSSHGLHCDVISSDISLALASRPSRRAEPGVLVVCAEDSWSLLFLDIAGAPAGVTTLAGDDATLVQRLIARIDRHAAQTGSAGPISVSFADPTGMAQNDIADVERQLLIARAA